MIGWLKGGLSSAFLSFPWNILLSFFILKKIIILLFTKLILLFFLTMQDLKGWKSVETLNRKQWLIFLNFLNFLCFQMKNWKKNRPSVVNVEGGSFGHLVRSFVRSFTNVHSLIGLMWRGNTTPRRRRLHYDVVIVVVVILLASSLSSSKLLLVLASSSSL